MTKKQGPERETAVANGGKDDDVSSAVVGWTFLNEKLPDFINDPLEKVSEFIESLPFISEVKVRLFKLIKDRRKTE